MTQIFGIFERVSYRRDRIQVINKREREGKGEGENRQASMNEEEGWLHTL